MRKKDLRVRKATMVAYLLVCAIAGCAAYAQEEKKIIDRTPVLKELGDAYELLCTSAGFEYVWRDDHQLASGKQWGCTGWPFNVIERVSNG